MTEFVQPFLLFLMIGVLRFLSSFYSLRMCFDDI